MNNTLDYAAALRGLSTSDESTLSSLLEVQVENIEKSGLDARAHAFVRLGALVALDAAPASFIWQVNMALQSGLTKEEIVGVLVALAPTIGLAKVVSAAPELAFALDVDLEAVA